MKITEYSKISTLNDSDVMLIDGTNGTKTISVEQLRYMLFDNIPEMHNNIYRGKNLGSSVTSAQYQQITSGKFSDLYVGDYWTINGFKWQIVDFDYFYNSGNSHLLKHHAVIMPTKCLYQSGYESTNTNENGYFNSKLYKEGLIKARQQINAAFTGHIIEHDEVGTYNKDGKNRWNVRWDKATVGIPSVYYIYPSDLVLKLDTNNEMFYNIIYSGPFALFQLLKQKAILTEDLSEAYWLRECISTSGFATSVENLTINWGYASTSYGVRPYFLIG